MTKKFATILMLVGATLAFPAEEEQRPLPELTNLANFGPIPTGPLPEPGQDGPKPPQELGQDGANPQLELLEQPQPGLEPPQGQPGQPQGPEGSESDLKTDATFWWGRSYYPVRSYRRSYSYYRPRSYSYYTPYYTPYYSTYWNYW